MKTITAIVLLAIAGCGNNAERRAIDEECSMLDADSIMVTRNGETYRVSCQRGDL